MTTPRVLHAQLHLMDRQIVDFEGGMVAKVDDLELDLERDPPVLTAFLTGPQAWGPRLPGLLGRFVVSVHRRLRPDPDPGPNPIPAALLADVTSAVVVLADADVDVQGFGRWVDEQIIERIPGSGHASK